MCDCEEDKEERRGWCDRLLHASVSLFHATTTLEPRSHARSSSADTRERESEREREREIREPERRDGEEEEGVEVEAGMGEKVKEEDGGLSKQGDRGVGEGGSGGGGADGDEESGVGGGGSRCGESRRFGGGKRNRLGRGRVVVECVDYSRLDVKDSVWSNHAPVYGIYEVYLSAKS
jgi:hypothetical protein